MHVPLPADKYAHIDIINLFVPGDGDRIRFPAKGFSVSECRINGEPTNFARYVISNAIDTRLPLVADYSGAMINVSIKAVDLGKGVVDFYAPVFDDVEYRFAAPVTDYVSAFQQALQHARRHAVGAGRFQLQLRAELSVQRTRRQARAVAARAHDLRRSGLSAAEPDAGLSDDRRLTSAIRRMDCICRKPLPIKQWRRRLRRDQHPVPRMA
jgi:hypothetical protein